MSISYVILGALRHGPTSGYDNRIEESHPELALTIPLNGRESTSSLGKKRLGKQRGAKIAQIDLARRLAEAIWHMLTREQPLAPKGVTDPPAA